MLFVKNFRQSLCVLIAALLVIGPFVRQSVYANDEDEFEFRGVISALPNTPDFTGDWTIDGRKVHVTSSTRIERDGGNPAVGKTAEVDGVLQQDGSINARQIEIKTSGAGSSDFEFRGRVEQLPTTTGFTGDWLVGGRTIHVTSATTIDQTNKALAIGVPVRIVGTLRSDGTIDARRIQTEGTERPAFFEFTGQVQNLPTTANLNGDWIIGGRTVHVTPLTRIEREDGPINVGTMVKVKGTVRTDGSIDAVKIEPAETSANAFVFHGVINTLPNTPGFIGDWTVDGRTLHVSSATRIQQDEGLAAPGALVEVSGTLRSDGSLDATRIEVERSAGEMRNVPHFELEGTVEKLPGTANLVGDWVVSGRTIHVSSATLILPGANAISVGTFVEIEGSLRPDNSFDASSVEVERVEGTPRPSLSLFGRIDSLPATTGLIGDWVVSGRAIHVASTTQLITNHRPLTVGSFVKVTGNLLADGSIDAQTIQVKRSDSTGRLTNFFELFGLVETKPSGLIGDWRISGLVVHTTSATHFAPSDKVLAVGSRVKVVGRLRTDGTLDADAIVVQGDIDDSRDFVTTHYDDFLGRDADDSGRDFWIRNIDQCGSDDRCRQAMRVNTSAAFFLSIEFQQTGYLIERLYVASFGRLPRLAEFLADARTISEGVIVNQPGWQQKLDANTQAFIDDWVHHPAFVAAFGAMSNAQYVDALIARTGITLSNADRNALIDGLNNGTLSRAQVLRQIVDNKSFREREFNRAFVLMQYFGYLRRDPDDAPDGDMSGFNFWLNKLNKFNGNFANAEMVRAFLESAEYRNRFAHK